MVVRYSRKQSDLISLDGRRSLRVFSNALLQKNPDYGDFDTKLKAAYKSYKLFYDVIKDYNKNFDTSLERLPDKYENFNTYMYLNYTKAMLMFDSLCQTMGERPFLSALKNTVRNTNTPLPTKQT